jgi:hypothetical protein
VESFEKQSYKKRYVQRKLEEREAEKQIKEYEQASKRPEEMPDTSPMDDERPV